MKFVVDYCQDLVHFFYVPKETLKRRAKIVVLLAAQFFLFWLGIQLEQYLFIFASILLALAAYAHDARWRKD